MKSSGTSLISNSSFYHMGILLIFLVMVSKLARNLQEHFSFLKQVILVLFPVYKQNSDTHLEEECDYPSPSLVSLPVDVVLTTKEQLSIDAYSCPWESTSNNNSNSENEEDGDDDDPRCCAVCLENYLEARGGSKARQLRNCRHVFHKECLGAWVQRGHTTCPVCRAKLLADQTQREEDECPKFGQGPADPWRLERMMYLFGEDVLF